MTLIGFSCVSASSNDSCTDTNDISMNHVSNLADNKIISHHVKSAVNNVNNNLSKVYVSEDGDDSNNGSLDSPKASIGNAVRSVSSGGTVFIKGGTYHESDINISKSISLIGDDSNSTIIDSGKKRTFTIKSSVLLKNLTICNAKSKNYGGSIFNNGSLTLEAVIIKSSSSNVYGGAVYNNKKLVVKNSSFNQVNARYGGAIYNKGSVSIINSSFNGNRAMKGGALFSKTGKLSTVRIVSSVFEDNSANIGGALYVFNHTKLRVKNSSFIANCNNSIYINTIVNGNLVYNSTFSSNIARYGGAVRSAYTNLSVKKCVFTGNRAMSGGVLHNFKGYVLLNYNFLANNSGDVYTNGLLNANLNWWASNKVSNYRIVNVKLDNWLYLTVDYQYKRLVNSPVTTIVSVYNKMENNSVKRLSRSIGLPNIPLNVIVNGCDVNQSIGNDTGYVKFSSEFDCEGVVSYNVESINKILKKSLKIHKPYTSNMYIKSIQEIDTNNIIIPINITDKLNNTIKNGTVNIYLNNEKILTKKVTPNNKYTIPKQKIGTYDIKVTFTNKDYQTITKKIKLTINPKTNYNLKIVENPALFTGSRGTIRAQINNKNNSTTNTGTVKFYLDNKHVGTSETKNNLSTFKMVMPEKSGQHQIKIEYYQNNKFILSAADYRNINYKEAQKSQNTFITLTGDLINNNMITSTKKDVYFAMDRTTATYDNSPNDMKIMNNIAYNLRSNGFNVKTVRNGPGETYETARYMYKHKIRNSICFVLCNGVDANVIREYLKGYDNLLTTVRNRGNDIVLGWFYGAGNIYDQDGEYYYWLQKAWDDNYSSWGGISNPRKKMEKDGIKIVYEKYDLNGDSVAKSFTKLYGGKITEKISKNNTISLRTNVYTTNNKKINGRIVYTLNDKVIKNVTVKNNLYTFKYKMPSVTGTYNLKATYYVNNKVICSTNRYLKVE